MAKPLALTPDALRVAQQTPQAATPARSATGKVADTAVKAEQVPLQVRLPREDVRAIKIAAAEREQTISDFMLTCFHAYMKDGKHE